MSLPSTCVVQSPQTGQAKDIPNQYGRLYLGTTPPDSRLFRPSTYSHEHRQLLLYFGSHSTNRSPDRPAQPHYTICWPLGGMGERRLAYQQNFHELDRSMQSD